MAKTTEEIVKEQGIKMFCTLELADGTTMDCAILKTFSVPDMRYNDEYAVLKPLSELNDPKGSTFLYRIHVVNEEPQIEYIESDEEFDIVLKEYNKLQVKACNA